MTIQFGKRIEVVVGDRRITEHEIRFEASLSLTPDPDEATVSILNLSSDDRGAVESAADNGQVVIFAGYGDDPPPAIFRGRARRVVTAREAQDLVTTIEAPSAWRAREYGRQLHRTYRAGTQVGTVIRDLLRQCEVGEGTLSDRLDRLQIPGLGSRLSAPFSVSGPAWDSLVELLESNGFSVTTQGDDLVSLGVDDVLDRTAIVLTWDTGLRGSPSVDRRGVLSADAAMIPGLIPGRRVQVRTPEMRGEFKVTKATYRGSLYGSEFGVTLEGRTLQ